MSGYKQQDLETISAEDFGRSLKGMGLNLLVKDVEDLAVFLSDVFGMSSFQRSKDFAIVTYGDQVFQIHADHTYHSHPLPSLIPESGVRGSGIEIRLYESDPDRAVEIARSHRHKAHILQEPENKPHGLRECVILCRNGYAWLPSRRLSNDEIAEIS